MQDLLQSTSYVLPRQASQSGLAAAWRGELWQVKRWSVLVRERLHSAVSSHFRAPLVCGIGRDRVARVSPGQTVGQKQSACKTGPAHAGSIWCIASCSLAVFCAALICVLLSIADQTSRVCLPLDCKYVLRSPPPVLMRPRRSIVGVVLFELHRGLFWCPLIHVSSVERSVSGLVLCRSSGC